ncbi:MAG TPA: O-antigen ligase family protein, partial [Bacillota bacterium]|nr:O-antigen ligase family protein [Bacillota bacterium]
MNREVLDQWCERGILALVIGILVIGPLATGAVGMLEFLTLQGLTLGVMILWGARLWLTPRPRVLFPPICWAVLAFAGYAIGRYFYADIEYVARQELVQVLVYTFLFFAILNNLHRQESTQVIIFTLLGLATLISFYALYQFLADSDRVWNLVKPYRHRGSGTYICPNHLGGFLEMLLPLGLAYTLVGRAKPVTKVFLGYASLMFLAGIAVTLSRGSWLATGLALLLLVGMLLTYRNYRLIGVILLVVLVGTGTYFLPRSQFFQERLKQTVPQPGKVDDSLRFALWRPALRIWQDHFWWGAGPGHFDVRFRAYRPEAVQLSPSRVHNDYLNTLADWGLVGAVLVAGAWALLGLGLIKTWRSVRLSTATLGGKSGSNKFAFVLGASLGLVAILVHSFLDFNMHIPANAILAVALMALLTGHVRFATERFWLRLNWWTKPLPTLLLVAGLGYLGAQGWRQATECLWLNRAAQALNFSPEQIERLTQAFAAEPRNAQTAYDIAEAYRLQSWAGGDDSQELAAKALEWFDRAMKLNPWDGKSVLGYGLCLDWLGRTNESAPYFDRAEQLDPNSYFTVAHIGLHYVNLGDYAAAKPWFERSLRLKYQDNPVAFS